MRCSVHFLLVFRGPDAKLRKQKMECLSGAITVASPISFSSRVWTDGLYIFTAALEER